MLQASLKNLLSVTRHVTLFALVVCSTSIANANPVLDSVAAGNVTVQQSPSVTQVNQTSQTAIINWNSFNIGANEATHFQQPTNGVALNRINPQQGASQIFGTLTATGQVILVNQAGIYFGSGAQVNVGGLIASTSDITDKNFLAGNYIFDQASSYANASVVNAGSIIAAQHGLVALLGSRVSNDGYVQAELGSIVLASGSQFTVNFGGDGLVNFSVDAPVAHPAVSNTGMLIADGGKILMSARAAQGVLDNVINMQGIAQANSVDEQNGEIILDGGDSGYVNVAAVLQASGLGLGQTGGIVKILGEHVTLQAPTVVNVSGDAGGGEILVGGNFHGGGPEQNALTTTVSSGSILLADAITQGNGGRVAVWSNGATEFHGTISAKGGALSGNGGYVETSGAYLNVQGAAINLFAQGGQTGTWLLDPSNLTICFACSTDATTSGSTYSAGGSDSNLLVTDLTTALNSANVTVETSSSGSASAGDILVNAAIVWNSPFSLTLTAYRNIDTTGIAASSGDIIKNSGSGGVVLHADNTGTGTGTVLFNAGNDVLASGGVNIYYNPATFGTQDTIYSGGTTPTQYMLIQSLGTSSDSATTSSLGALSNNSSLWSKDFALAKNIDASDTINWNSGAGFSPIGNSGTPFTGKFDGQNYMISDITIITPTVTNVGLFGATSGGAQIQNIVLNNFNISGASNVGTLIGEVIGSTTINNITATGNVLAANDGGGLIGAIILGGSNSASLSDVTTNVAVTGNANVAGYLSTVLGGVVGQANSSASSTITLNNLISHGPVVSLATGSTQSNSIGGLVGELAGTATLLENSSSTSNVTAGTGNSIGGLVGVVNNATVTNSFSTGTVIGRNAGLGVGGLVGILELGGTVSDSYSTSTVQGFNAVGGLVGFMDSNNSNSVTNSYSEGSVSSIDNEPAGGLVGIINGGTIQNSYSGASVTSSNGGGLIGEVQQIGTVNILTNYSAGSVFAYSGVLGYGFIGNISGSPTLTNNFWDEDTSGQTTGAPSYNASQLVGLSLSGTSPLLASNYTGWDIGTTTGHTWYQEDGYTRPILQSEYSTTIANAHQLQLINLDPTANYQLATNVDASRTSNASDVWDTTVSSGTGFDPIARGVGFTGNFNGNGYVISNIYMAPTDTTNSRYGVFSTLNAGSITNVGIVNGTLNIGTNSGSIAGMLLGQNDGGTLTNDFSTGTISETALLGQTFLGGLVGVDDSGNTISNSYSSVNITNVSSDANNYTGGFIGALAAGGTITNSYATGTVGATNGYIGGFVGELSSSGPNTTIQNSYSSGAANELGSRALGYNSTTEDGFIGLRVGSTANDVISNSFVDSSTNINAQSSPGVTAESTANMITAATFLGAGWDISSSTGHAWYILDGQTRPILQSEYSTSINTAHQLQLMNLNLAANYTLSGNVDASNTAATNTTDVWAGNTFSPVGSLATPFTGIFNGQFNTISNLNITSSATEIGLFGAVGDGISSVSSIQNLTVSNAAIDATHISIGGNVLVGTVAGTVNSFNANEVLLNNISTIGGSLTTTSAPTVFFGVGGVVGYVGFTTAGGLIENVSNNAKIDLSAVSTATFTQEGGITAEADNATLINVSNSGEILGNQTQAGGIAGELFNTAMRSSYNIGLVEAKQNSMIGGLVATLATASISTSYNAGPVLDSQTGSGNSLGGLVGELSGNNASTGFAIADSYNLGAVIGNGSSINVGGLVGIADSSFAATSTINRSFNTGYVVASGSGNAADPLIGKINGGVTVNSNNNFYNSDTTGASSSIISSTALTNSQMMTLGNFTGFGSNTWGISSGETYPYLLATNPGGTPQIISGTMPVGANNAVGVAAQGSQLANSATPYYQTTVSTAQTGNNGFFYLQENPIAIPFNQAFLTYLTSTSDPIANTSASPSAFANIISKAQLPGSGSGTDGTTGLAGVANTVYVNNNVNSISNADFKNAIGSLGTTDLADFLYSASALTAGGAKSDITLGNATHTTANLVTPLGTSFTLSGNILTTTSGTPSSSVTFNGPLTLSSSSNSITTDGDQTYNNTVTNNGTSATFNANSGAITFNGVISNGVSGGGITFNTGSTITYNAANTYTGFTTVTSGTLTNGLDNAVPSSSRLTVNGTYDLNGFNESTVIAGGSGTITNSSGTTVTLTDTGAVGSTYSGGISGNLNLLVSGSSASLNIAGTSSYTGSTNVTNNASLTFSGTNTTSSAINVDSTSTLGVQGITLTNTLNLNGSLSTQGATLSGPIHLGANATISNRGNTTINSTIDGAYDLAIQGRNAITLNGSISGINNLTTHLTVGAAQITLGNITITTTGNITFNNKMVIASGATATINAGGNLAFDNILNGTLGTESLNIGAASTTFVANVGSTHPLQIAGTNVNNDFIFGDGVTLAGTLNGGGGGTNTLDFSAYTTPVAFTLSTAEAGTAVNNSSANIVSFSNFNSLIGNGAGGTPYTSTLNLPTSDTPNTVTLSLGAANQGVQGSFSDPVSFNFINQINGQSSGIDQINFSGFSATNGSIVNGVQLFFTNLSQQTAASTTTTTTIPTANIISAVYPVSTTTMSNSSSSSSSSSNNNLSAVTYTASGATYYSDPVSVNLENLTTQQTQQDTASQPTSFGVCPAVN